MSGYGLKSPIPKLFGMLGEAAFKYSKKRSMKYIDYVDRYGDNIASAFTKNNRSLKVFYGILGVISITTTGIFINKQLLTNSTLESLTYDKKDILLPRINGALSSAMKFALNGELGPMNDNLDAVKEMINDNPSFKSHVKFTKDSPINIKHFAEINKIISYDVDTSYINTSLYI